MPTAVGCTCVSHDTFTLTVLSRRPNALHGHYYAVPSEAAVRPMAPGAAGNR